MDGQNCLGVAVIISMEDISVEKSDDCEQPIPTAWRFALKQLADNVILGTQIESLTNIVIGPIDDKTASSHQYNIDGYPDKLGELNVKSWETSIYIWNATYWTVLVDLSDRNGDTTDLVFYAKVHETSMGYLIEPGLIYVP